MGRVVNACSKRAPSLGANLGVLALLFSMNERLLCYARDKDDTLNPILGASLTGPPARQPAARWLCLAWRALLPGMPERGPCGGLPVDAGSIL